MVTASIVINQVAKPAGSPSVSREDLDLGVSVALSNFDNTGVISWAWLLVSRPPGSAAVLTSLVNPTTSFTPDVRGSYLIRLTVSDGVTSDTDARIAAVETLYLGMRIPAISERDEFNATSGWAGALHTAFTTIDGYAPTYRKTADGYEELHYTNDMGQELRLSDKGYTYVILRAPNGFRFKLSVDNNGNLITTSL